MWLLFALLSSVFAALTSILAKVGISGVNSNLATAIRTVVVLFMAWGMVFLTHTHTGISEIGKKAGCFLFYQVWQQGLRGCVTIKRFNWEKHLRSFPLIN